MFRMGAAILLSIPLLFLELWIVLKLNQYSSIQITHPTALISLVLCNTFLIFSALTQLEPWLVKMRIIPEQTIDLEH